MTTGKDLRVVVSCVTFETVKVVKPILYYKADKAYLIHMGVKPPYEEFIKAVEKQLTANKVPFESVKVNILEFNPIVKELVRILKKEKAAGNHIYVNIGAGPTLFSAAAFLACMMEGGKPFTVRVEKYMINDFKKYFEGGSPVGLAKEVHDPHELPAYGIIPPNQNLIKGLRILETQIRYKKTKDVQVIEKFTAEGLMDNIYDGPAERKKISQSAKMKYRRKFLDSWKANGWVISGAEEKLEITAMGKTTLDIFGER